MSKQIIKRTIVISEKDLKRLRKEALVESPYGNKKLYDTCEWVPLDSEFIVYNRMVYGKPEHEYLRNFHWYNLTHRDAWQFKFEETANCVIINPMSKVRIFWHNRNRSRDQRLGLATLVKEKA